VSKLLSIDEAARHIASGRVVAYPTEAVYGLGCDPDNAAAVQKVLDIKSRHPNKGFIIIAAAQSQLQRYMEMPTAAEQQTLNAAWPGPVTFVVRALQNLPAELNGGRDTMAVRVSSHPVVVALCTACTHALISTSANHSGNEPLRSADEVLAEFGDDIAGVVAGDLGALSSATPIHSLISGEQIR